MASKVLVKKDDHEIEVHTVDLPGYLEEGYELVEFDKDIEGLDSTQSRPIPFQAPQGDEAGYAQTSARVRRKGR